MIRPMATESTSTSMVLSMKANGRTISRMATVLRPGLMALSMRDTTRPERSTTEVKTPGFV